MWLMVWVMNVRTTITFNIYRFTLSMFVVGKSIWPFLAFNATMGAWQFIRFNCGQDATVAFLHTIFHVDFFARFSFLRCRFRWAFISFHLCWFCKQWIAWQPKHALHINKKRERKIILHNFYFHSMSKWLQPKRIRIEWSGANKTKITNFKSKSAFGLGRPLYFCKYRQRRLDLLKSCFRALIERSVINSFPSLYGLSFSYSL